jgi:voltage-gated potassium channel Kch
MRLDLVVIAKDWLVVLAGAAGLVALKAAFLYALARAFGGERSDSLKIGAALSQGGEFSFVVFSLGADGGLFSSPQVSLMSAIVTISMASTPLLLAAAQRLTRPPAASAEGLEGPKARSGHAIIVGFGRAGQIISQVLNSSRVRVTAIDLNPAHIRNAERFGFKVYYGDGSRLDTLLTAGALDALAVIFAMDDADAVTRAVAALRERAPHLTIIALAHDRMHEIALRPHAPDVIVRETLESSLVAAREALRRMNYSEAMIDDFIEQFRKLDRERLLQQMDYGPEAGVDLLHKKFDAPEAKT